MVFIHQANAVKDLNPSFHLSSPLECARRPPTSPFASPHQQPDTTPVTPGKLYFLLIFLDIPSGLELL